MPDRDPPPPNIEQILDQDLSNDTRLGQLYTQAVQQGYWANTPQSALDFAALAEKALHDDNQGTPARLFYALIKRKDPSRITQEAENRAMRRFPSHLRQQLVDSAAELPALPVVPSSDVDEALNIHGIGYSHAVMVQCFLPQRPAPHRAYRTSHGRASLMIEAGHIANPNDPGEWIECQLPAGPKPRIILPYIVGQAVQTASPKIDLGRTLAQFMNRLNIPVAGNNITALTQQIQNIAAAHILIGEWSDDSVRTRGGRLAKQLSFWVERGSPGQRTLWSPEMTLSDEFFAAIQNHRVPIDIGHLARLARSPRRMDLYTWLAYRTPRIRPNKHELISLHALHRIFGPNIKTIRDFKRRLLEDLRAIHAVYPQFNVTVPPNSDTLWLRRSPPPVPYNPTHPPKRTTTSTPPRELPPSEHGR